MSKFHIRKDDVVEVISGSAKGKQGRVLSINTAKSQATIEGVKTMVKATRQTKEGGESGLVRRDAPIHVSNLKVVAAAEKKGSNKKKGA
jgi:large subunit ribosomal protein L24